MKALAPALLFAFVLASAHAEEASTPAPSPTPAAAPASGEHGGHGGQMGHMSAGAAAPACAEPLPKCAATAEPAFARDGTLWLAYSVGDNIYAAASKDSGTSFGPGGRRRGGDRRRHRRQWRGAAQDRRTAGRRAARQLHGAAGEELRRHDLARALDGWRQELSRRPQPLVDCARAALRHFPRLAEGPTSTRHGSTSATPPRRKRLARNSRAAALRSAGRTTAARALRAKKS